MKQAMVAGAVRTDGDAVYKKVAVRLIPVLMTCYILNYLDRSNIGFAKLAFTRDLGMSEAVFGLGGGLFYIGYSLFEIPSNLLLAKVGARLTLLRIMIGWGICATCFAFMTTATHYYILRTVLGIAEAGFFPGVLLFISYWVPPARRAGFTAMFMSAMAISGIIGGPLSGTIMSSMAGVGGLAGWQWMFIIEGVPSILMGVVTYLVLADRPADARWLDPAEKALLAAEFEAGGEGAASGHNRHSSFGAALKDLRFWSMAAMSINLIAGAAGLQLWMPTVLRHAGLHDLLTIGLLSSLPFIVAVVAQQVIARSSDRRNERRWHAAVPSFVAGAGWLMLTVTTNSWPLSLVALTLAAAGIMGATGPFWSMPSRYLSGTAAAGGLALISMMGGVGSFVSPAVVGWLSTHTGTMVGGFIYYAALMVAGPLLMLWGTSRIERAA